MEKEKSLSIEKDKCPKCGLFNQDYNGRKIIELVRLDRRTEKSEIEGQMTLFDYFGE